MLAAGRLPARGQRPDIQMLPRSRSLNFSPLWCRPLYSYRRDHSPEARATCARSTRHAPIRPRLVPVCGGCACFPGCAVRCCLVFQVLYMEAGQMTESDFSLFPPELYHVKAAHAWHSVSHRPPGLCSRAEYGLFPRIRNHSLLRDLCAISERSGVVYLLKRACLQSRGVPSTNPTPPPSPLPPQHTYQGATSRTLSREPACRR